MSDDRHVPWHAVPDDFIDRGSGIYSLWCPKSGKDYLAHTTSFAKVYRKHFLKLHHGDHHVDEMQEDYDEHGRNAFVFAIVERVEEDQLLERIKAYRDVTDPETLYNPPADEEDEEAEEIDRVPVMERPEISEEDRQLIIEKASDSWPVRQMTEYLNNLYSLGVSVEDVKYVLRQADDEVVPVEGGDEAESEPEEETPETTGDTEDSGELEPELQGLY